MSDGPVAIVGGGSIGVAFALVFARAGHAVRIIDPDVERRVLIPGEVDAKLAPLESAGLLAEAIDTISARVSVHADVTAAVRDAVLVQECVPERRDLKRALFTELSSITDVDTVLASSSSAISASQTAGGLGCEDRVLVAHPGNPPHLIPIIELVPSPATRPDILRSARELYTSAGLSSVLVNREVEGFVFNRLQGALLREAYALVRDGVAEVEDVDTVVRDGLGRRWAFMGPFETADLNTRGGIASHAAKMGPAYERMGAERGQHDPWTEDLVAEVTRQRRAVLPLANWEGRVAWRDAQLVDRLPARTVVRAEPPPL